MNNIVSPSTLVFYNKNTFPTFRVKIINLFFWIILKRSFVKRKEM